LVLLYWIRAGERLWLKLISPAAIPEPGIHDVVMDGAESIGDPQEGFHVVTCFKNLEL
jgi:hypothetical protein